MVLARETSQQTLTTQKKFKKAHHTEKIFSSSTLLGPLRFLRPPSHTSRFARRPSARSQKNAKSMSKEAILVVPKASSSEDVRDGSAMSSSSSSTAFPQQEAKERKDTGEEKTAQTEAPNAVKTMRKDDKEDDEEPRFNFRRVLTHKESHVLAEGIKSRSAVPKSGCYVHYCVYCGGERGCPIGMSYNRFTRESMCWSLNTYPFGCCALPMQRDWKEYVSIKNDIKVVVIDKETNTLACFSGVHCCYCQPLNDS